MSIIQPVQDADCSGRTLATLLVAWVAMAMVASILLRWEYMWAVLAILTVLFLLVCGYTAYYVKRNHARMLLEQQRRIPVRTVSGMTGRSNCRERSERLECSTHYQLNEDLPPSYASIISVQPISTLSPASLQVDRSGEDKFEEPPPYSTVIDINVQEGNTQEASSVSNMSSSALTKKDDTISTSNAAVASLVSASASASLRCIESN